ncbi:MAG: LysE family translocator [Actinomycetota bacterium]|nr:LysE family translocator [Actinomycetota bacterium]
MPDAHTFVVFGVASLALLIVPGPAVFYIVTRSIADGRRAGAVSMLGIEAGGLVHVAAAALGVSALLASSATAFAVVKYLGAAYLIYLGVRQLLRTIAEVDGAEVVAMSTPRLFWQGFMVQVLNPKVALFFLAFLPQFIDPTRGVVELQVIVLGVAFTLLALLSDGLYVLAVGTVANVVGARTPRREWLTKLGGGVYIGLGVIAALSGPRPAATNTSG